MTAYIELDDDIRNRLITRIDDGDFDYRAYTTYPAEYHLILDTEHFNIKVNTKRQYTGYWHNNIIIQRQWSFSNPFQRRPEVRYKMDDEFRDLILDKFKELEEIRKDTKKAAALKAHEQYADLLRQDLGIQHDL